jgi:hypothetical protein
VGQFSSITLGQFTSISYTHATRHPLWVIMMPETGDHDRPKQAITMLRKRVITMDRNVHLRLEKLIVTRLRDILMPAGMAEI